MICLQYNTLFAQQAEKTYKVHEVDAGETLYGISKKYSITVADIWKANPSIPDMRTAAYVSAINKVGTSYAELGIFP